MQRDEPLLLTGVVLQEEEVKMATVVYLVVAAVGTMFVALSLIGLQSEERKN